MCSLVDERPLILRIRIQIRSGVVNRDALCALTPIHQNVRGLSTYSGILNFAIKSPVILSAENENVSLLLYQLFTNAYKINNYTKK